MTANPPPMAANSPSKDQFLQDLARVVPALSLPSMRGNEVLQRINPKRRQWRRSARPNAEGLVAQSLLHTNPSPFKPPSAYPDLTELNWDEEGPASHWPVDDDAVFYRMDRMSVSAEGQNKRGFFDINIVMPLVIPGAEIRVLNEDGENYYNLAATNPGTHLLFGRETRSTPPTSHPDIPKTPETEDTTAGTAAASKTDNDRFVVKTPPAEPSPYPAVCDVWATFLNAQLGIIRNVRSDQVLKVCQLFNEVFAADDPLSNFLVPITVDCKGIYPVPQKGQAKAALFERYETRGTFLSDNDRKRFRIIRRKLKRFVLMLWEEFGIECDGPKFEVALSENCRTGLQNAVRIEIRRYAPLTDPELLRHIWRDKSWHGEDARTNIDHVVNLPSLPAISASARVVLSELRLEMTHARMLDPRWPEQWVLSRRMPAIPGGNGARPMLARHVFCSRVDMPKIVYEFAQPQKTLLKSRFAPLYLLTDKARKEEEAERQRSGKLNASAIPFYPLSTLLDKLGGNQSTASPTHRSPTTQSPRHQTPMRLPISSPQSASRPTAWDRLVTSATLANVRASGQESLATSSFFSSNRTMVDTLGGGGGPLSHDAMFFSPQAGSPLVSPSTDQQAPSTVSRLPVTIVPCKFYQAGSCARGDSCYFLHPADPKLENNMDVRMLSPTNPLYF